MTALMGNSSHCQHARGCEEGRVDEWEGLIKKEMMDEETKLLYAWFDGVEMEVGAWLQVA